MMLVSTLFFVKFYWLYIPHTWVRDLRTGNEHIIKEYITVHNVYCIRCFVNQHEIIYLCDCHMQGVPLRIILICDIFY